MKMHNSFKDIIEMDKKIERKWIKFIRQIYINRIKNLSGWNMSYEDISHILYYLTLIITIENNQAKILDEIQNILIKDISHKTKLLEWEY